MTTKEGRAETAPPPERAPEGTPGTGGVVIPFPGKPATSATAGDLLRTAANLVTQAAEAADLGNREETRRLALMAGACVNGAAALLFPSGRRHHKRRKNRRGRR